MPKLRVFSGAELCDFLTEHGFERVRQRGSHVIMRRAAKFLFPFRSIANSTAARSAASFVKVDCPGRSSNKPLTSVARRRRLTSMFNSQSRKGAWPRKTNLRGFALSNITCRAVVGAKAETSDIKSATGRIRHGDHRRVCGL